MAAIKPGTPGKAFWDERESSKGEPFLIRAGIIFDEGHVSPGQHLPLLCGDRLSAFRQRQDPARADLAFTSAVIPGALILGSFLGWIHGRPRAHAGEGRGAGRAAHFGLEPQPAHSHAAVRRRTGLPDPHLQSHDRAAGSLLPADEAVLGRRLARAAHAHHRHPRPARSGAVHRQDHRPVPRGDVQRAAGYRPAVADRARAAAAVAGRIGPAGSAEIAARSVRGGRRPGGAVPDSRRRGRRAPDGRPAARSVSWKSTACRSSA